MTTCPNCKTVCEPIKFLIVSKWTPYVCGNCGVKSDFPLKQSIMLGTAAGLLLGILSYFLFKLIGGVSIIAAAIIVIIAVPFIEFYFLDLEKVDD